jgi:hypothetical protein
MDLYTQREHVTLGGWAPLNVHAYMQVGEQQVLDCGGVVANEAAICVTHVAALACIAARYKLRQHFSFQTDCWSGCRVMHCGNSQECDLVRVPYAVALPPKSPHPWFSDRAARPIVRHEEAGVGPWRRTEAHRVQGCAWRAQ